MKLLVFFQNVFTHFWHIFVANSVQKKKKFKGTVWRDCSLFLNYKKNDILLGIHCIRMLSSHDLSSEKKILFSKKKSFVRDKNLSSEKKNLSLYCRAISKPKIWALQRKKKIFCIIPHNIEKKFVEFSYCTNAANYTQIEIRSSTWSSLIKITTVDNPVRLSFTQCWAYRSIALRS